MTLSKSQFIAALANPKSTLTINGSGRVICEPGVWEVEQRRINDHLIYYCESGRFNLWTESGEFILRTNELFWMQPGIEHHFTLPENQIGKVIFCRISFKNDTKNIRLQTACLHLAGNETTRSLLEKLATRPKIPRASHAEPNISQRFIFGTLVEYLLEAPQINVKHSGLTPHQTAKIEQYIADNLKNPISPRRLAALVCMNPAYFARQFKQSFGMSPRHYITMSRIDLAATLLQESNLTISELADYLGYRGIFLFSRQFKIYKGITPTQWRNNN
ncbi:MAG: helix-turn-helix domain-containing protein [Victivallaceae bacterium]|nr:helix-turn-helix domain-containing protein [Victivallaceae bacterium]